MANLDFNLDQVLLRHLINIRVKCHVIIQKKVYLQKVVLVYIHLGYIHQLTRFHPLIEVHQN